MNLRIGNEADGILGYAVVFHHDIEAPAPANEAFINLMHLIACSLETVSVFRLQWNQNISICSISENLTVIMTSFLSK